MAFLTTFKFKLEKYICLCYCVAHVSYFVHSGILQVLLSRPGILSATLLPRHSVYTTTSIKQAVRSSFLSVYQSHLQQVYGRCKEVLYVFIFHFVDVVVVTEWLTTFQYHSPKEKICLLSRLACKNYLSKTGKDIHTKRKEDHQVKLLWQWVCRENDFLFNNHKFTLVKTVLDICQRWHQGCQCCKRSRCDGKPVFNVLKVRCPPLFEPIHKLL